MSDARETIQQMIRLWNDRDPAWPDQFDEDAEITAANFKMSGPEAARTFRSLWQDAFPNCQVRTLGIYQDGDVAVLEAVFEGTHTGTLNLPEQSPIEATNQKVSIPFTQVHTVRNGRVRRLTGYFDSAAMMSQLGLGG
jgi:predicted ester cyclase